MGIHNNRLNRRQSPGISEAEWRPVQPPMKTRELVTSVLLAIAFFGGAAFCFWSSGVLNWWELKRFGQETSASVVDLDFRSSILSGESYSSNLLTVHFRDSKSRFHEVKITDPGRFAADNQINPHNPRPSLPKQAAIVYSRRDPGIAELRDYRNHGWWMFVFSIVLAGFHPAVCFLVRREALRNEGFHSR
jgi:hypothetical protein